MLYLLTNTPAPCPLEIPVPGPAACLMKRSTAESLSLPVAPGAGVYLPPVFIGVCGGGISPPRCCLTKPPPGHESRALMDIGTNGEMALWHNGTLYACSTAGGPASKGAGRRSMGMNGETGAH